MFLSLYTERRPIGLRPPSDRIASAARSDCVRRLIGLRSPSDRIASAARRVEQSFYNTKSELLQH